MKKFAGWAIKKLGGYTAADVNATLDRCREFAEKMELADREGCKAQAVLTDEELKNCEFSGTVFVIGVRCSMDSVKIHCVGDHPAICIAPWSRRVMVSGAIALNGKVEA